MSKETSNLMGKQTTSKTETDTDDDDIFDGNEFVSLAESHEEEVVKTDSRRKIEIYWEKKRLKDQFDDIDESEFGF